MREKTPGGREVRIRIQKWCVSKSREVGRFVCSLVHTFKFLRVRKKKQDSEVVCLKIKGGREVCLFVGSYLQFLESARKNPRR